MAQIRATPSNVVDLLNSIGETKAADAIRMPTTASQYQQDAAQQADFVQQSTVTGGGGSYADTAASPTIAPITPQSVLEQFNAIRSRVNTVVQPENLPPAAKGEPRGTRYVGPLVDGKPSYTAYSTGTPRTQAEFEAAIDTYDKQGKVKGFTVLEPGVQQHIRDTFESTIGAPMRAAASTIQNIPVPTSAQQLGGSQLQGTLGRAAPGVDAQLSKVAPVLNMLKGAIASVPHSLSTPEGVGTAAGVAASSALLPGLGPLSTMLKTAAGAGAGYLAGDIAAGTNAGNIERRFAETMKTATIAALTEGATGVVKNWLGMGLSQRAHQQVADDFFQLFKDKYRPLMNDPKAFDALMSSPQGIRDFTQIGIKALRGDIDTWKDGFVQQVTTIAQLPPTSARNVTANIVNQFQKPQTVTVPGKVPGTFSSQQFTNDVNAVVPWTLSKGTVTKVRKYVRQLADEGNKLLDNIDNTNMQATIRQLMRDTGDKIISTMRADFAKATPAQRAALEPQVQSIIDSHVSQLFKFTEAAHVLSALKQSGAASGFDVAKFQRIVQNTYKSQPGSLMEDVGNAAFRGGSGLTVDRPYTVGVPYGRLLDNIPLLNKVPGIGAATFPIGKGTQYVGKVKGTYPGVTGAAKTTVIPAIRDYLDEQ